MSDTSSKNQNLTFFPKNPTICPVCSFSFFKEELLTGRGRIIAGHIGLDLRRHYQASQKFGRVLPNIYSLISCPQCFYSAFPKDFASLKAPLANTVQRHSKSRKNFCTSLLGPIDFSQKRDFRLALASYLAAIISYHDYPHHNNPLIKQAICSLRAAWLCLELHHLNPHQNYHYLQNVFYHKSFYLYKMIIKHEQNGSESISDVSFFGPDSDHNYGYDGVLYLSSIFELYFGDTHNPKTRFHNLSQARLTLARIVGLGKSSQSTSSVIIEKARVAYQLISQNISSLKKIHNFS